MNLIQIILTVTPTENKTHECHKSSVTVCVFSFTSVYSAFFVINCHNTREYTFFISKIVCEYAALFFGQEVIIYSDKCVYYV